MIVIHHNPDCGTSRNVLAIIEASGETPTVIEYLKEGWTRPQLLGLFAAAGLTPRSALRETKSPAKELGLLEAGVSDEAILEAMLEPVQIACAIVMYTIPLPCGTYSVLPRISSTQQWSSGNRALTWVRARALAGPLLRYGHK